MQVYLPSLFFSINPSKCLHFKNSFSSLLQIFTPKLLCLIKIAPDKRKHFFVGIVMGAVLQLLASHLLPEHFVLGIAVTFVLVIAISYGFEVLSLITGKGHYEILDAIAAIIGGVIGMGVILLFQYLH